MNVGQHLWARLDKDERVSIGIGCVTLLILGLLYIRKIQTLNIFDHFNDTGTTLLLVSVFVFFVLVLGYILNLFSPAQVGDAFTIIDFGLLSGWVKYYQHEPSYGLIYGVPFMLIMVQIFRESNEPNYAKKKKHFFAGQALLYIFALLATIAMANNDGKSIIDALQTPGMYFYLVMLVTFIIALIIASIVVYSPSKDAVGQD